MGVDFDVAEYCKKLRLQDPPYICPVESCGKPYQSVVGINYHLLKFDHNSPEHSEPVTPICGSAMAVRTPQQKISTPKPRSSIKSGRKKKSSHRAPLLKNAIDQQMVQTVHEGMTYAEAQRMVEFEVNGITSRVEITHPLRFMSKEEFDASQCKAENNVKQEDNVSTPNRKHSHGPSGKKSKSSKAGKAAKSQESENKVTLPEACFKVLDNYHISDAPPRPTSAYIRFIEKSAEELDGEVEYDMDEEDSAWLGIINDRRADSGLPPVPVDAFELLMDRLEKECYFMMQVSGKAHEGVPSIIDDDAVCCICMDGECQNSNVILFCDMCNLAVHQDCYGVPYIPEGQWLCRRCLQSPSRAVDCVLCPNNGGAFKQTDRGHWAHVVCALWIPEVRFANTVFLEPIDSIETIPPARWKLTCYICKQRGVGACIQCHKTNCYAAFHVTCAQQAGLYMKMDTVRDSEPGPIMVQKTAYCDTHTPPDAEPRPRINSRTGGGILAMSPPGEDSDEKRDKMKHARRILAKRRSWAPIISIPTIPPERIQEIATHVCLPKKNQFIQRLIAYWTLKRQFRNGVPLLRRLQSSHSQRRDERREEAAESNDVTELHHQLRYWQCLRQDLERARLLCELVRKREKLKKEFIKVKEQEILLRLTPLQSLMHRLLDAIQTRDTGDIFGEPVDQNEVVDYAEVVKEPMDLSTMRAKLEAYKYHSLDDFQKDFNMMVNNCLAYNCKETVFYKAGVKMRDQGGALIRLARKDMEAIGFDRETSLLLDEGRRKSVSNKSNSATHNDSGRKGSTEASSISDDLAAEIDMELEALQKDRLCSSLEQRLNKLLELKEVVQDLKTSSRTKREKIIRTELANVRRKMSLLASGKLPGTRLSKSDAEKTDTNTEPDETTEDELDSPAEVELPKKSLQETKRQELNDTSNKESKGKFSTGKRGRKRKAENSLSDDEVSDSSRIVNSTHAATPATPDREAGRGVGVSPAITPSTPNRQDGDNVSSSLNNSGNSLTSASPSGVNRRTAVLFTRKAASVFRKPDAPGSPASLNNETLPPTSARRKTGRPKKNLDSALGIGAEASSTNMGSPNQSGDETDAGNMKAPPVPCSDSFRVYRSGGDIVTETDDDTQSETSCSSCSSGESSAQSYCDESDGGNDDAESEDQADDVSSGDEEPESSPNQPQSKKSNKNCQGLLPPLQLVWAKCRGYPWYPALIIDPAMPHGYTHNGVPIPAPPDDVLALKASCKEPVHLVLFFDTKRTWQWLPRNKLELLGDDKHFDQAKLIESRKPADRKAVRKAYKDAILHSMEITGTEVKGDAEAAIAILKEDS